MLSFIYRSPKKEEMYLYLLDKNGFEELDDSLQKVFGTPEFVMVLDLDKRDTLARVDIQVVRTALIEQGYYLQMPPRPEDLADRSLHE